MIINWKKFRLVTMAASGLFLAACGSSDVANEESETLVDGNEIEIAYVAWDDAIASANVVGTVLQDAGYDVTLTNLDNAIMWQSVATGETDTMLTASLPDTHGPQYKEYGDQMVHAGVNMEGARNALVVPSYMEDVNSIEDLSDQADQTITGIEAGAGIMGVTEDALDEYENLSDWTLSSSSSGAMVTELTNSINNQEEIVVTGWIPHWKFLEYDLKMLEDPLGVMGGEQTINTFTREGLEEDEPIAFSILSNFDWGQISNIESVMYEIAEGTSPEEAARNWVDENQELVNEWTAEAQEIASSQSE